MNEDGIEAISVGEQSGGDIFVSYRSVFVSYAQNYEDVMLWRALKGVDGGFYIDVGAQDPVADSVTKAFYDREWHGINVEPVQYWHDRLMENRPRDINLCVAASSSGGSEKFFEVADTGLSTASRELADAAGSRGFVVEETEVVTRTLDDIISTFNPVDIHFLKIDVEGVEKEVLEGIDLAACRPWIVVVEATEPAENPAMAKDTQDQWEDQLTGSQYTFVYFDGLNRFYVASEHSELCHAFRYPPSHLIDGFITYSEYQLQEELSRTKEAEYQLQEELAREKKAAEMSLQAERQLGEELERERKAAEEHEKQLLQAKSQVANLEMAFRSRQAELAAIYSSTSWRITKPIRTHTPIVSKLRRIYKGSFLYRKLLAKTTYDGEGFGYAKHGSTNCYPDETLREYELLKWHISSRSRNLSRAGKGDRQLES